MANGLTPDIGARLARGAQIGLQFQQQQRLSQQDQLAQQQADAEAQAAEARQAQLTGLLSTAIPAEGQPLPVGGPQLDPRAAAQLAIDFPDEFEQINKNLGLITSQRKSEALDFAFKLRNTPFAQRQVLIDQRSENLLSQGRQPTDTNQLTGLTEQDQNEALDLVQVAALSPEKRIELAQGPEPTALQKNIIAAGFTPGTPEFTQEILKVLTKPAAAVTVALGGQETEERKKLAGVQARRFETIITESEAAGKTLASLNQFEALDISQAGALEPAKAAFAAVVKDLGFGDIAGRISDVTNAQNFQAVSNRLVQDVLNAATGPQTDQDAERAAKTIANLGDDPLAAQFKNDSLRALSLRQRQRGDFIGGLVDEGKTFSQANKEWVDFTRKTPNISDVVKNPATGLPIFFFQFEKVARRNKPDVTQDEIIQAWRNAHGK